jgi:hypothetical protein
VAWQYYHARKRSEETPLEYLHRLNVAGMCARLKIKDGDAKARLEHVEHCIKTLGDPALADQLTLLRLSDAETCSGRASVQRPGRRNRLDPANTARSRRRCLRRPRLVLSMRSKPLKPDRSTDPTLTDPDPKENLSARTRRL